MANIALDLLGQARALLSYAGQLEDRGRTEDDLAYFRSEREFGNLQIVELDNGDFAQTIARQLLFSSYQLELYQDLQNSRDETLAGVAAKAVKEVTYHRDHATQWALRLGDGTPESHRRMQAGLERIWPYVARDVPQRSAGAGTGRQRDSRRRAGAVAGLARVPHRCAAGGDADPARHLDCARRRAARLAH